MSSSEGTTTTQSSETAPLSSTAVEAMRQCTEILVNGMTDTSIRVVELSQKRVQARLEALRGMAEARTPVQAARVHLEFWQSALDDYVSGTREILTTSACTSRRMFDPILNTRPQR